MIFSAILDSLINNYREIRRSSWEEGVYITRVSSYIIPENRMLVRSREYMDDRGFKHYERDGWLPSTDDLFADDWEIVKNEKDAEFYKLFYGSSESPKKEEAVNKEEDNSNAFNEYF